MTQYVEVFQYMEFFYLSCMWDEPRHIMYFGPPQDDDSQIAKIWKGGRVGIPKIQGKFKTQEHHL